MGLNVSHWLLRRVLKYSAPVIRVFQSPAIKKYSRDKSTFQPVFIIGPPRSGSTILYQLITKYLDVLYIDNLMNMARECTWFGAWLSQRCFSNRTHNSFRSDHGKTASDGLHAPNEGLFWYQWLPKDKHFVDVGDIRPEAIKEMQDLVFALCQRYQKPLVIKNLSFSVRLRFIKEAFPEAKLIYIRRDPRFVAQSILVAKQKSGLRPDEVWSIHPKEVDKIRHLPAEKQAVHQSYYICKQIHEDLNLFEPGQIMVVDYESLNTEVIIPELAGFIPCRTRTTEELKAIAPQNTIGVDRSVFEKIEEAVNQLDWENFTTNMS